ncbi:hypothetical protein ACTFQF_00030 [Aliivibrio fischeri]|uniref:hypothetical protein n=1 Tax=Aliivibrio fischeri TaxID=668 RepID=UPI0007C52B05|nr:hypothetical protein [Aliivibrio fischeri]
MSSCKYLIDNFPYPVITDMEWSFSLGVTNQRSYHDNFGSFFKANTSRGILNKISPSAIEVGVVNNEVAKNESNCVSLSQVEKIAIFGRADHLITNDALNVYVFQLDKSVFHVIAISGKTIKIDRTLNFKKESFEVDLSAFNGKLDDMLFGNVQPLVIRICISNDEVKDIANAFVNKTKEKLETSTKIEIKHENFDLVSLLSDVNKNQIIFLKNIDKFNGLININFKFILMVIAALGYGAYYWHSLIEEEKQEKLRLEILQKEVEAKYANDKHNEPVIEKKDLKLDFEINRTERINQEIKWYEVIKRVSGNKLFKITSNKIKDTIVEVNGWKTQSIIINNTLNLSKQEMNIEYLQDLLRLDTRYGAKAILDYYPDIVIKLDGVSAFNESKDVIYKNDMIGWDTTKKHNTNTPLIINVINDLQRLEHEKKIQSWSLGKTVMVTPEKLTKKFIDDYFLYESNADANITDSDWVLPIKFHKLIVNGVSSNVLKTISDTLNQYSSPFLSKVTYTVDTQKIVLEVIIHEQL